MVYFPEHRIEHALQLDSADHHSCKEGLIEVLCLNTIYVYRVRRLVKMSKSRGGFDDVLLQYMFYQGSSLLGRESKSSSR